MVHRAERMMAARGQVKTEGGKGARRLVHAVAHIDDDMIENGWGQRHGVWSIAGNWPAHGRAPAAKPQPVGAYKRSRASAIDSRRARRAAHAPCPAELRIRSW